MARIEGKASGPKSQARQRQSSAQGDRHVPGTPRQDRRGNSTSVFEQVKEHRSYGLAINHGVEAGNHAAHRGHLEVNTAMFDLGYTKASQEMLMILDAIACDTELTYKRVFADIYTAPYSNSEGISTTVLDDFPLTACVALMSIYATMASCSSFVISERQISITTHLMSW